MHMCRDKRRLSIAALCHQFLLYSHSTSSFTALSTTSSKVRLGSRFCSSFNICFTGSSKPCKNATINRALSLSAVPTGNLAFKLILTHLSRTTPRIVVYTITALCITLCTRRLRLVDCGLSIFILIRGLYISQVIRPTPV